MLKLHNKERANVMSKLRVISGKWRGRKITFRDDGIRPTAERIRETVFNWLQYDIQNAICLDLFAGSGAMGIEALSRGAGGCTFVDSNSAVLVDIEENLRRFDVDFTKNTQVVCGDYKQLQHVLTGTYDIVFVDPPYSYPLEKILLWCQASLKLSPRALVYIESDLQSAPWLLPENWDLIKYAKTRRIAYGVCEAYSGSS